MRKILLSFGLLAIMINLTATHRAIALDNSVSPDTESQAREVVSSPLGMAIKINTPAERTILFKTQNGEQKDGSAPIERKIPHLVLNRNGVPTPGYARALKVSVAGLSVPHSGMYVQLTIETQHGDPDLDRRNNVKIQVWKETSFVPFNALTQQGVTVNFTVTFEPTTTLPHKTIKTPTDYYRYRIDISDPLGNKLYTYTDDYAFLMENQWRVPLPELLEATPGAAPEELLIYYYDMAPFQVDMGNPKSQIPRRNVDKYIQTELIPAMIEAMRVQSNTWKFPWYDEWRNFRKNENPKALSVALSEQGVWFHGEVPVRGHSMISLRIDGSTGEYNNLTDGLMSTFHHELFHNHQRNINLHYNEHGTIAGKDEAWMIFSEGTAVLASSVGQPGVQFDRRSTRRSYFNRANAFIGANSILSGGLNKSYEKIPYQTAIYWRFLYEKCGGMGNGSEDPATGMRVIRRTLETLYKGEIVDINSSIEVIESLPLIMDHALATTPSCPFHNYKESLSQFTRAIYLLGLEDSRCPKTYKSKRCGFFDPNRRYSTPHTASMRITDQPSTIIDGNIPTSYGMDFVEIELDQNLNGKSLQIWLDNTANSKAEFAVTVLAVKKTGNLPTNSAHRLLQVGELGSLVLDSNHITVVINTIDTNKFDRIGLIITRMDSQEKRDNTGNYTIQALVQ